MLVKIFKKDNIDITKELDILKANNIGITENKPDFIVTFGGDGTILKASKYALFYNVPILAVNFGKVGYMAEIEAKDFEKILKDLKDDRYNLSKRYLLCCDINGKKHYALNEIVFKYELMGSISLYDKMQKISDFRGDGLIISTATGSTAYAMSAGGSIIHPSIKALNVVAIAPHNIGTRAIILPDSILSVKSDANIYIDGILQEKSLLTKVNYSDKYIELVEFKDKNYYDMLRVKLDWKG